MPSFPIIDTHLHLWDPSRISYSWQKDNVLLGRAYGVTDYQRHTEGIRTEAMIFVECHIDDEPSLGQYIKEIEFVEEEAKVDPRIRAIVAKAPLERGERVAPILEEMVERFPRLKGIRRIPEFELSPRAFMLNPNFIAGVRLLQRHNLHFELNVNYTQMGDALEFLKLVPDLPIILDHCGKPGIKGGHIDLFRRHMKAVAVYSNVWCKLSDLPVEADWSMWSATDLRPYIDAVVDAFTPNRILYGGDWPVCLQATTVHRWIATIDNAIGGLSPHEARAIYRDNANRFYRLNL